MLSCMPAWQQKAIRELVRTTTGIRLPESLEDITIRFIQELQDSRGAGAPDFSGALALVETEPSVRDRFIRTVTIGETYLFREESQFRVIRDHVIPELQEARKGETLDIWSAACSTGEEAWSLAMLADKSPGSSTCRVWGSDINDQSLALARSGNFGPGALREDGRGFHDLAMEYMESGTTTQGYRIRNDHKLPVEFHRHNLKDGPAPFLPSRPGLILLRNVLIYLDEEVRTRLVDDLVSWLAAPGYLFLSATEVPLFSPARGELREFAGVYCFHKSGDAPRHRDTPSGGTHQPVHRGMPDLQAALARTRRATPASAAVLSPAPPRPPAGPDTLPAEPAVPPSSPDNRVRETLARAFSLVDAGDSVQGIALLDSLGDLEGIAAAAGEYLRGHAALGEGQAPRAVIHFTRCLDQDSGWWLARYHRALLNAVRNPPAALREFTETLACLDSPPDPDSWLSSFLEGFSLQYYREICTRWIRRLKE